MAAVLIPVSRRPEEAALRRLCDRVRTGKEPGAARFYREEGNRRFGRRRYRDAARLYSQVGENAGDERGWGESCCPAGRFVLQTAGEISARRSFGSCPPSPRPELSARTDGSTLLPAGRGPRTPPQP